MNQALGKHPERLGAYSRIVRRTPNIALACLGMPLFLSTSCETIPPGTPPKGPLVEVETTVPPSLPRKASSSSAGLEGKSDTKTGKRNLDSSDAVNAMVTSLATRCAPITTAASPPRFANRFVASSPISNNLQMEVWRRLVRMGMVDPATNTPSPDYELVGNITPLPFAGGSKKRYSWTLKAINSRSGKLVWKEKIEFSTKN